MDYLKVLYNLGSEVYKAHFSDLNPEDKIRKKNQPIYLIEGKFIFPDGSVVDEEEILYFNKSKTKE